VDDFTIHSPQIDSLILFFNELNFSDTTVNKYISLFS
jgi:hypothetical protein